VDTAVQFDNRFASRLLVQSVDVLGYHSCKLAVSFEAGECFVGFVGAYSIDHHFFPVKSEEFLGMAQEKKLAQDGFRRIIPVLVVESVGTSEVRNAAFGGYSGAAEEHDCGAVCNQLLQQYNFVFHYKEPSELLFSSELVAMRQFRAQVLQSQLQLPLFLFLRIYIKAAVAAATRMILIPMVAIISLLI
jgi:hypothetical protein